MGRIMYMNKGEAHFISFSPPSGQENYALTLAEPFLGCYVTIDGTRYESATALILERGTEIQLYVPTTMTENPNAVTLNGESVQSGGGTYTFYITANTTITITARGGPVETIYSASIITE